MIILFLLNVLYFLLLFWVSNGVLKYPNFRTKKIKPLTKFSIVIPFRNEAPNLKNLLASISALDYPPELFEVILIDDDSTDNFMAILDNFKVHTTLNFSLLKNRRKSASPKKDAISTAINHSKHKWVVTTDADCQVPIAWLRLFDQFIQQKPSKLICGPVLFNASHSSLLQSFQVLDGISLQAVTLGSIAQKNALLCNGANLCYKKSAFKKVSGYSGNDHIASGDDIFLLEKIKRQYPEKIHYLKNPEAIVVTKTEATWKQVFSQRIRWASKTSKQKSISSKVVGSMVFLANIAFIGCLIGCFFDPSNYNIYLYLMFFKVILDLIVLAHTSLFLKARVPTVHYFLIATIYPFIAVGVVLGMWKGKYRWKERTYGN